MGHAPVSNHRDLLLYNALHSLCMFALYLSVFTYVHVGVCMFTCLFLFGCLVDLDVLSMFMYMFNAYDVGES